MNAEPKTERKLSVFMLKRSSVNGAYISNSNVLFLFQCCMSISIALEYKDLSCLYLLTWIGLVRGLLSQ